MALDHYESIDLVKLKYVQLDMYRYFVQTSIRIKDGACQYRDIFAKVMTSWKKQILARVIRIQLSQ